MKRINYTILEAVALFTQNWMNLKDEYFAFCKERSSRYGEPSFARHMYDKFIDTDVPITLRAFSLDSENQRLLLEYIFHLTDDAADFYLEVPETRQVMVRDFNIVKELPDPIIVDDGDHTIIWAQLRDFQGDVGIQIEKPWDEWNAYSIVVSPDCALSELSAGLDLIQMICERLWDYAKKTFGHPGKLD